MEGGVYSSGKMSALYLDTLFGKFHFNNIIVKSKTLRAKKCVSFR